MWKLSANFCSYSLSRVSLGLCQPVLAGHLLPLLRPVHLVLLPQEHGGGTGGLQHGGPDHPGHLHLVCLGHCRQGLAEDEEISTEFSVD